MKFKNVVKGVIAIALVAVIAFGVYTVSKNLGSFKYENESGTELIKVGDGMTDEQISAMLASQQRNMRIHIWTAPYIQGEKLTLGFENNEGNPYAQAVKISQNGKVVYQSGAVEPGKGLGEVTAPGVRIGEAEAEIVSIVDGKEYGNSVSCQLTIVGTDSTGNTLASIN